MTVTLVRTVPVEEVGRGSGFEVGGRRVVEGLLSEGRVGLGSGLEMVGRRVVETLLSEGCGVGR